MRKQSRFIFLLGFILYGWLEFETLIFVGNIVGGFLSFIGIFLTAFIGIYLIRRLNRRVFLSWQSERQNNKPGLSKLAEGLSILLGGLLLVIPGYLTDLIGLICMIPILRTLIGSIIIANFADIRLFADLRKKHEYNDPNKENSETTSPVITIDGDYTEK
ncbi:MAG: FxsA family protein [Alphaproteobacteria bacterium]|nr:FxsA family protein [Alphaproteobacteria bacterium]